MLSPKRRHGTPGNPWGRRDNDGRTGEREDEASNAAKIGPDAGKLSSLITAKLLWYAREAKLKDNIKDC